MFMRVLMIPKDIYFFVKGCF